MSSIADILLNAQDGRLVDNAAARLGLSSEQTAAAVDALRPALAAGLRRAADDPGALEKIIAAVAEETPQHAAFLDAETAHAPDTVEQGREILTQLFGSADAPGKVAQIAARASGLRPDVVSQLLPVLAAVVLGGLFKSLNAQGLAPILAQIVKSGGLAEILGGRGKAGGLGDILDELQAPAPAPRSGGGGGGGLLGRLLGALFGGRPQAPTPAPAPAPLPGGLDPAALRDALTRLKNALQPAAAQGGVSGHDTELDDALGEIFGPRRL